jgi:peptide/nickel transport system permease protein
MKGTMLHQTVYRRPTAIAGVALALVMAVTGIFAPVLAPHDPNAVNVTARLVPPGGNAGDGQSHILGTDHFGRDLLSRIVTSFRINLYIGLLGTLLGLLAAWLFGDCTQR